VHHINGKNHGNSNSNSLDWGDIAIMISVDNL